MIRRYRPPCVIFAASSNSRTLRQLQGSFGIYGIELPSSEAAPPAVGQLQQLALKSFALLTDGAKSKAVTVIIVTGRSGGPADTEPVVSLVRAAGLTSSKSSGVALTTLAGTPLKPAGTRAMRTALVNLPLIKHVVSRTRSTHIVATLGPACWSELGLAQLLEAGVSVVRFNFSHGSHAGAPQLPLRAPAAIVCPALRIFTLALELSCSRLCMPIALGAARCESGFALTSAEHFEVLQRFRKVCQEVAVARSQASGSEATPTQATLLDTKARTCTFDR